jgi:CPA2 family monovalent cation:H+ antiporter-2
MLIIIGYLGGDKPETAVMLKQIIGGALLIGVFIYILKKKEIKLPFRRYIEKDHEVQVFVAFTLCFGFSIATALFGLSSALGAFIAGIILSATKTTRWVHDSLHAFKIMFVALFFVSVGMLIDLQFLKQNALIIGVLVLTVLVINNIVNVLVMHIFCKDWKISLYAGALLSQIGEFSFILGSTGYFSGIISFHDYKLVISIIALTLFFSPLWINLTRKIIKI